MLSKDNFKENVLTENQKISLDNDLTKLLNDDKSLKCFVKTHNWEDILNDEFEEFKFEFSNNLNSEMYNLMYNPSGFKNNVNYCYEDKILSISLQTIFYHLKNLIY